MDTPHYNYKATLNMQIFFLLPLMTQSGATSGDVSGLGVNLTLMESRGSLEAAALG